MFICNLKLNKNVLCRMFIVLSLVVVFFIILYSIYVIFFKKSQTCDSYKNNIIDLNDVMIVIKKYLGLIIDDDDYYDKKNGIRLKPYSIRSDISDDELKLFNRRCQFNWPD